MLIFLNQSFKNYRKLANDFLNTIDTKEQLSISIYNLDVLVLIEVFKILVNLEYFEYIDVVLDLLNEQDVNMSNPKIISHYYKYINYLSEINQAYKFWDSINIEERNRLLVLMKTHGLFDRTLATLQEHELIGIWKFVN